MAPLFGNDAPTTVLIVEDNPVDAGLIQAALTNAGGAFHVEWVTLLSAALKRLGEGGVDVVMLDLTLPDGPGLSAFDQVFVAAPNALILVLGAANDEATALQAIKRGALDYLPKSHVDAHWLPRALHYVIERKATRGALRNSEARFRAMSDASPLGIFVSDAEGSCVYTNAAYHKISGLSFEQALGTNWSTAIHPDDRQRVLAEWHTAMQSQEPLQTEFRFLQQDGSIVWTRINSAAMSEGLEPNARVQTVEDITERKLAESILRRAEEALFEEKERAQITLNSIGDAVLTTDSPGNVTYMNLVAESMTGWSREDASGRPLGEVLNIINATTRETVESPARRTINEDQTMALATDSVLVRRDGVESAIEDSSAPIHTRDGEVAGAVIVFHDVSESRAMAQKMTHLAQHDFLTDLPNRVLLIERLNLAISLAFRHGQQVGLIYLDLDAFKNINDSLGHAIGDQLLQSVGERLVANVRGSDTVCRQGGDEFVILLSEITQPQDAALIADKLLAAFTVPHLIGGHELHITLSIGISLYPDDSRDADSLMQNADTAMYNAKANGRNNYQFFKTDMNTRAVRRLSIENNLRRALKQGEFLLYYQPQIDLGTGAIIGAEALIRWKDPNDGLVSPLQYIPIAEESGLIVGIGRWVLNQACQQVKSWLDAGLPAVPVAVNISAVEFRHPDFIEGLATILNTTGLPPSYLELELTESILMHDADASGQTLKAIKNMGVKLAIDDFGTGYSSLSYLKRFPIDTLKIDQSFVRDITTDTGGATIVSAVIGMGKNLKQRVVGEGVENEEQLAFLKARQCDIGQGFLFSLPLPAQAFAELLVSGWLNGKKSREQVSD